MNEAIEEIKPYLQHKTDCPRINFMAAQCGCQCGLDEVLAALEQKPICQKCGAILGHFFWQDED